MQPLPPLRPEPLRAQCPHPGWTPALPVASSPGGTLRPGGPGQLGWGPALPTNPHLRAEIGVQVLPCPAMARRRRPPASAPCPGASILRPARGLWGQVPPGPSEGAGSVRLQPSPVGPGGCGGLWVAVRGFGEELGCRGVCTGLRAAPCAAGHPEEKAVPPAGAGHGGLLGAAAAVGPGAGGGRHGAHVQAWVSLPHPAAPSPGSWGPRAGGSRLREPPADSPPPFQPPGVCRWGSPGPRDRVLRAARVPALPHHLRRAPSLQHLPVSARRACVRGAGGTVHPEPGSRARAAEGLPEATQSGWQTDLPDRG